MDTFTIVVLILVMAVASYFVYQGIQKTLNEKDKPVAKPNKRAKK